MNKLYRKVVKNVFVRDLMKAAKCKVTFNCVACKFLLIKTLTFCELSNNLMKSFVNK